MAEVIVDISTIKERLNQQEDVNEEQRQTIREQHQTNAELKLQNRKQQQEIDDLVAQLSDLQQQVNDLQPQTVTGQAARPSNSKSSTYFTVHFSNKTEILKLVLYG